MSALMSDMELETFTARELDRKTARVLDVCDHQGAVRIRRRDGRTYLMRPERAAIRITRLPDFAQRRRRLALSRLNKVQASAFDRLLAGE
jgi:hypothetical protein